MKLILRNAYDMKLTDKQEKALKDFNLHLDMITTNDVYRYKEYTYSIELDTLEDLLKLRKVLGESIVIGFYSEDDLYLSSCIE